jgi:hypothetical protein
MAKRFTDTEKWKRTFFADLGYKGKLAWIYLLDNCDHRGVWNKNYSLMSFQVGFKVTNDDIKNWFEGKAFELENDKIFVPSFIDFQYPELNPNNNAHKSIIKLLEKLGPIEDLKWSTSGPQVKVTVKDKVKVNKGGLGEKFKVSDFDLESIYQTFPRKEGKSKGLKFLTTDLKNDIEVEQCKQASQNYAKAKQGVEIKFIKLFQTWVSEWRDWVEWSPQANSARAEIKVDIAQILKDSESA